MNVVFCAFIVCFVRSVTVTPLPRYLPSNNDIVDIGKRWNSERTKTTWTVFWMVSKHIAIFFGVFAQLHWRERAHDAIEGDTQGRDVRFHNDFVMYCYFIRKWWRTQDPMGLTAAPWAIAISGVHPKLGFAECRRIQLCIWLGVRVTTSIAVVECRTTSFMQSTRCVTAFECDANQSE